MQKMSRLVLLICLMIGMLGYHDEWRLVADIEWEKDMKATAGMTRYQIVEYYWAKDAPRYLAMAEEELNRARWCGYAIAMINDYE